MHDHRTFRDEIVLAEEVRRLKEENDELRWAANAAWELAERLSTRLQAARYDRRTIPD
jgi:hypothetical protein